MSRRCRAPAGQRWLQRRRRERSRNSLLIPDIGRARCAEPERWRKDYRHPARRARSGHAWSHRRRASRPGTWIAPSPWSTPRAANVVARTRGSGVTPTSSDAVRRICARNGLVRQASSRTSLSFLAPSTDAITWSSDTVSAKTSRAVGELGIDRNEKNLCRRLPCRGPNNRPPPNRPSPTWAAKARNAPTIWSRMPSSTSVTWSKPTARNEAAITSASCSGFVNTLAFLYCALPMTSAMRRPCAAAAETGAGAATAGVGMESGEVTRAGADGMTGC